MNKLMTVGSLFSGIGGFDLGLERAGMSVSWQVENNDYCNRVLTKHWPNITRYGDIKTIDWKTIETVDLVCGGFPCQPFSVAGKRRGKDDDRYLWPEVVRCLDALRPTWFFGENVYGLLHLGIEQMYADLEALGYQVAVLGIPACAVDAPHIRKRIWILGYADKDSQPIKPKHDEMAVMPEFMADTYQLMQHGGGDAGQTRRSESADGGADAADSHEQSMGRSAKSRGQRRQWPAEPSIRRVVNGIPNRSHRLKGLGNAIVPAIVENIGKMILEVERANLHRM